VEILFVEISRKSTPTLESLQDLLICKNDNKKIGMYSPTLAQLGACPKKSEIKFWKQHWGN